MRLDEDWTLKHSIQQLALIVTVAFAQPLGAQPETPDLERVLAPFGAYDARGQDLLWSTANEYQRTGQHERAIPLYRQAAHLSRVNEGLNSASQIPYIKAEITSYRALNQLSIADDRQNYLARLEKNLGLSGSAAVSALLRQAEWNQHMLLSNADDRDEATARMGRTWNLYVAALNKSLETYGEGSVELMPALEGMIRAHYLLADHQGLGAALPGEIRAKRDETANVFRDSYKRGVILLTAIQNLNRDALKADLNTQAEDFLRLGDWALWTGNRAAAYDYYDAALAVARGEQPHLEGQAAEETQTDDALALEAVAKSASEDTPSMFDDQAGDDLDGKPEMATLPDSSESSSAIAFTDSGSVGDASPMEAGADVASAEPVTSSPTEVEPLFRILDTTIQLPAIPGFGPVLPVKTEGVNEDDLIVSFNINAIGKPVNIERIQVPVVETVRGPERVIRRLKATRFRPVFENGKPVESETITLSFDKSLWARSTVQ